MGTLDAEELRYSLTELSKGHGVKRLDLRERLQTDFSVLQQAWGVNLNSENFARRTVVASIDSHIVELVPRTPESVLVEEQRKRQYRYAVAICFNVREISELERSSRETRFKWLEKKAPNLLRVSKSTARRYLKDAIDQIVEQLTSPDYEPVVIDEQEEAAKSPSLTVDHQGVPAPEHDQLATERDDTEDPLQSFDKNLDPIAPSSSAVIPKDDKESPQPPLDVKPHLSRPHKTLYTLLAAILFAVAAITIVVTNFPTNEPVTSDPTKGSHNQGVLPNNQDALRVTVLGLTDGGSGWSVAFPLGKPEVIKEFLGRADRNEPIAAFFGQDRDRSFLDDALNAGGYILGMARIQLEIEGRADGQVTIYDVRVVPVEQRVPLASAAAIVFPEGSGSEEPIRMSFNLDAEHPIAKRGSFDDTGTGPFFEKQGSIHVDRGSKETFLINARPLARAHVFNLAIDYEIDGQKGSRLVTRNGQPGGPPFRVTASLCPKGKGSLPPDQRDDVLRTTYDQIRRMRVVDGDYRFETISQGSYIENCIF